MYVCMYYLYVHVFVGNVYNLTTKSYFLQVIVFGLASDVQYAQGNTCTEQKLLYATTETKYELIRFLDSVTKKQSKGIIYYFFNSC